MPSEPVQNEHAWLATVFRQYSFNDQGIAWFVTHLLRRSDVPEDHHDEYLAGFGMSTRGHVLRPADFPEPTPQTRHWIGERLREELTVKSSAVSLIKRLLTHTDLTTDEQAQVVQRLTDGR